jgi:hypothetical protein
MSLGQEHDYAGPITWFSVDARTANSSNIFRQQSRGDTLLAIGLGHDDTVNRQQRSRRFVHAHAFVRKGVALGGAAHKTNDNGIIIIVVVVTIIIAIVNFVVITVLVKMLSKCESVEYGR